MKSIKFTLETITPLFIAGADGQTPELRPPSIKGMMRFWWRAVKGEEVESLKKKEAEVFGSTDKRSRVTLKIKLPESPDIKEEGMKMTFGLDWDFKKGRLTGKHAGIGYLLYSVNLNPPRRFIPPDYEFKLILQSSNKETLKEAAASLWCAVFLGGFGTRARRGGGNLTVKEVKGLEEIELLGLDFLTKGSTPDEVADWFIKNYKIAYKIICGNDKPTNFVTGYSNLSFSRFVIDRSLEDKDSWIKALNTIGVLFEDFRFKHRNDTYDIASFGLPVMHRNKRVTIKAKAGEENIERRASPLIFKVLKVEKRYYWMVLRLAGEFLPEGGVVIDGQKTYKPDCGLIDEFWDKLRNKSNKVGKEFILSKPQILETIVGKIKDQINPEKITLFGSKARGDGHRCADIDLAVETNKPLGGLNLNASVDIVDLKYADERLKKRIEKEGVSIYERKS